MKLSIVSFALALGAVVAGARMAYPQGPPPVPAPHEVKPGETHKNTDEVEVSNDGDSTKNISINPKTGNTGSSTEVEVPNGAGGTVTGIDGNDTVTIKHNGGHVTIEGTGGTVNVTAGGAQATVTNTNPAGGNGASITIVLSGGSVSVPPGSTVNIP